MEAVQKRKLVIRHAQLVAAYASGNNDVLEELKEIEEQLNLSAEEIAKLAVDEYMRDY